MTTIDGTTRCEEIYASPAPSFWGQRPTSLVRDLCARQSVAGLNALDAGCGEGRNAVHLARHGAVVHAVDVSATALTRAVSLFGTVPGVTWEQADVTDRPLADGRYDVVVVYSLTHWLAGAERVRDVMARLRRATAPGGIHLYCAFNDRLPYPHAGDQRPTLLGHQEHLDLYAGWDVTHATDTDLDDVHPGEEPHLHAMTRVVARRPR
ncbi:class I SAM-dependent methyltransferase [Streptomyces triticirhizae]|uniref:Class I SAM-dependent methyltransferase n=1 Tax=Streptomyces triticirhizae TaxID=2483353 RepID=A0A3M2LFE6_9ACTN|nr:class I SAM-dependent methyltransferase [Streptomyces triticirhizae]RMI36241.1 class I SAM-dependent methyltransferase [Streptomyces triticirhizae]